MDIPVDEITLAALAARDGDQAAAARFVRATQADVWRLCAHLGDHGETQDLAQETYLRAFRSLGSFEGRAGGEDLAARHRPPDLRGRGTGPAPAAAGRPGRDRAGDRAGR